MKVYSKDTAIDSGFLSPRVAVVRDLIGSFINGHLVHDFRYHPPSGRLNLLTSKCQKPYVIKTTVPGKFFKDVSTLSNTIASGMSA